MSSVNAACTGQKSLRPFGGVRWNLTYVMKPAEVRAARVVVDREQLLVVEDALVKAANDAVADHERCLERVSPCGTVVAGLPHLNLGRRVAEEAERRQVERLVTDAVDDGWIAAEAARPDRRLRIIGLNRITEGETIVPGF
jgi:hypothetical protein